MKKLLVIILALSLVLSLAACGGRQDGNVPESNAGNAAEENVREPAEEKEPESDHPEEEPEPEETEEEQPPQEETEPPAEEEPAEEPEEEPEEELDESEEEPAVEITASHSDVTLTFVGHSFRLKEAGVPGIYALSYTSEDPEIAVVSADGTVTAMGRGTTTVTMHIECSAGYFDFPCIVRCVWEETSGVDLHGWFGRYMSDLGENAPAVMELPSDVTDAFYPGLRAFSAKQSVLYAASITMVPFEMVLLELEKAEDTAAVKEILQDRVESQINGGAFYPATIEAWENADIIVSGNFVALIVAGEGQEAAVADFEALVNE